MFNRKNKDNQNPAENPAPQQNAAPNPSAAPNADAEKPFDFNRYFLAERRVALENISYETAKPAQSDTGYKLTGKDTVVAQVMGNTGVKVTYNRTLRFEPDGPFTLSISYAVLLIFNPGTRDEVDWKTVDVATEFRKNCGQIIAGISARTSLLIAEITSASGQPPVILSINPQQLPHQPQQPPQHL